MKKRKADTCVWEEKHKWESNWDYWVYKISCSRKTIDFNDIQTKIIYCVNCGKKVEVKK